MDVKTEVGQPLPQANAHEVPTTVTAAAVAFVSDMTFDNIPEDALKIGARCILDTVGLYAAGMTEESTQLVAELAGEYGGKQEALLLGSKGLRVPTPTAARVLAISAHAHDFDDTQVSHDPGHVYGLLTHPTTAPLTAALVTADKIGDVTGSDFLTAFHAGFEVSCKVSEWLKAEHYLRGHHSSGTVATLGAAMTSGRLLGLSAEKLAHAIGIAASMAAGLRCSFGTMCKPWHVGRAAENGVLAAEMAARGFTGDPTALDGRWGFAAVLAGGFSPEKIEQGFGKTWSIVDPGVSIKPYPSGILTHQAMDMVLNFVKREDIRSDDVRAIRFFAGDNILNPIRYDIAANGLQAKFSMAALISMLVLFRRAGLPEFHDNIVADPKFQAMQRRVSCIRDAKINAQGFDLIRSRVEIDLGDGRTLHAEGDTRYRGGPQLPFSDLEVEGKMRACCDSVPVNREVQDCIVTAVKNLKDYGPAELLQALAALELPRTCTGR